ncbi:MAG: flavodoxin-dependent (E)-4-hydroxy-3-methylbut-2-enyl-diphosphate synthase, partial [candidate division Zixibacteria bacterium]|nr:flavodoxin-dependent (E)-4-hydroxy-3-methylbut-2-enyl-diphosphate synthase [candidate division Zixibacteria bacterium]
MFNRTRRISKHLEIGSVPLGGNAPISVQSMTTTDTRDIDATVAQIKKLEDAGCDIVRVAVLDKVAAEAIAPIKRQISIPLVADIHFQYRLALLSIKHGVDKLRINPGNIGDDSKVGQVAAAAREGGVPIRIGVNSGSLEDDLLNQYGRHHPEALVESALRKVRLLEKHNFHDIVISLKSSEVPVMVAAYRSIAKRCDYPLHLGVTEAGPLLRGTTKSALAFGLLLHEGIGDTLRVSLSADPVEEVKVGRLILQSLG